MNTESNNGWKVLLSLAIVAVLASVVLFLWPSTPEIPSQVKTETVTESVAPVASVSTIEDIEMAMLKNTTEEATLLNDSSEVEQVSSDSAALENVSKSYDENTL